MIDADTSFAMYIIEKMQLYMAIGYNLRYNITKYYNYVEFGVLWIIMK